LLLGGVTRHDQSRRGLAPGNVRRAPALLLRRWRRRWASSPYPRARGGSTHLLGPLPGPRCGRRGSPRPCRMIARTSPGPGWPRASSAIERFFETARRLTQALSGRNDKRALSNQQQLVLVHVRAHDLPSSLAGASHV